MQFIVDTSGRAASVREVWPEDRPRLTGVSATHYESFVESVRTFLSTLEFFPAELGACKAAQLVQMPFEFTLAR